MWVVLINSHACTLKIKFCNEWNTHLALFITVATNPHYDMSFAGSHSLMLSQCVCMDNTSYEPVCVCVHLCVCVCVPWLMLPAGWSHLVLLCETSKRVMAEMEGELNKCGLPFYHFVWTFICVCVCVYDTSVWRSGNRPSQRYGQIASLHMTATHSQTDRYKHIAFSGWERHTLRVQKRELTKDKHTKSTLPMPTLFFRIYS